MGKLSNPRNTIAVITEHDFDFRKCYGQNFLVDEGVILRTLEAARLGADDVVFEIGPGIGTLTQYLCETAYRVAAIEIDRKLIPILEDTLRGYDNVDIINEDVLKADLVSLAREYHAGQCTADLDMTEDDTADHKAADRDTADGSASSGSGHAAAAPLHPLKIVANLPYYITTPILMKLFRQKVPAQSITVMVQKEVADRMCAEPGGKDYGSLSIAVQYYSEPCVVEEVPPSCFIPHPKVTSAVVRMNLFQTLPVKAMDEDLFDTVVRAAFGLRRKTLVNALSGSPQLSFSKEQIKDALIRLGFSATVRGEVLSIRDYIALSDSLAQT